MAMAAPDWVQPAVKLASSWVFPTVALSSLVAHLFLVFFSGIRRRQAYGVRRFFLWLAYQVNNWAPIYVLGNLYFDTEPQEKQLYAFWVPFLMLHLARPDNISAYSMEDNALAGRVMLFVPFQSVGAFTIIYRYIHVDSTAGTLRPASWIMFSLAFFKYVESVMALRRGGLDNIRSSFKPRKSRKPGHGDDGEEEDEDDSEKESEEEEDMEVENDTLLVAHHLFDICKCAFADCSVNMGIHERRRAEDFGWKKMFKVVEMELSLMYDILYTKAAMVHTPGGYGIRVVSPFLTAAALLLFWFRYRDQGRLHSTSSRDVDISYILLGTTFLLDVTWLLRAMGSTWAHAFFKGTRRWPWVKHAVICRGRWKRIRRLVVSLDTSRLSISGCELLRDKKPSSYRAWSGIVGQHNLLRDFRDSERCSSKLAKSIGLEESWNAHCYSGPGRALDFSSRDVLIREKLFRKIWSLVHVPAPKEEEDEMPPAAMMPPPPSLYPERKKLDIALGFAPEIEEVVLIWHIATGIFLCYAWKDCPKEQWPTEIENVIRAVSDYMLFLIAVRPGMIPGLKFRSLYEETRHDLNTLWVDDPSRLTAGVNEEELARILRRNVDTLRKVSILSSGTRCALMMLRRVNRSISRSKVPESDLPVLKILNGLHPELFRVELDVFKMCEELDMTKMCKEWDMTEELCMVMMCEQLDIDCLYEKMEMCKMLDVIFDVWVRLLIYVSIRCSRDSHAKQLGLGVELTTIIWILTQHTDMSSTRLRELINGTNAAAFQAWPVESLINHPAYSRFRKRN